MKLRIERWESDNGRNEVHYYIKGTDKYVFGFNPAIIYEKKIKKILKLVNNGKRKSN